MILMIILANYKLLLTKLIRLWCYKGVNYSLLITEIYEKLQFFSKYEYTRDI